MISFYHHKITFWIFPENRKEMFIKITIDTPRYGKKEK